MAVSNGISPTRTSCLYSEQLIQSLCMCWGVAGIGSYVIIGTQLYLVMLNGTGQSGLVQPHMWSMETAGHTSSTLQNCSWLTHIPVVEQKCSLFSHSRVYLRHHSTAAGDLRAGAGTDRLSELLVTGRQPSWWALDLDLDLFACWPSCQFGELAS